MMDQNKQIVFASQSQKLSTIHSAISASRSALMLYRQQMQDDYQSKERDHVVQAINQVLQDLYAIMDACISMKEQTDFLKRNYGGI